MKEYGVSVTDKTTGEKIEIFFSPMSYSDWSVYSKSSDLYDKPAARYIAKRYVSLANRVSKDGIKTAIDVSSIPDLPPAVTKEIIDKMVLKAGFGDISETDSVLDALENMASTIVGAYDLFIYIHTNIETYLVMKDKNFYERLSLVASLQRLTGISVKERFSDSIRFGTDLDLVTPPSNYRPKKNGKPISPLRESADAENSQQYRESNTSIVEGTDLDSTQQEAINNAKMSLREALAQGRRNPKKYFDWNKDNTEFSSFEGEAADRKLMDQLEIKR